VALVCNVHAMVVLTEGHHCTIASIFNMQYWSSTDLVLSLTCQYICINKSLHALAVVIPDETDTDEVVVPELVWAGVPVLGMVVVEVVMPVVDSNAYKENIAFAL